jgi:hypothetical protein
MIGTEGNRIGREKAVKCFGMQKIRTITDNPSVAVGWFPSE